MNKAIFIAPVIAVLFGAIPSLALAQSDNQPTCPSGYSLSSDGTTCNLDQSQQRQQQPTCPSGYSLSSDGKTCTSNQPSTPTCPSGYTLSSDQKTCENNAGNAIKAAIGEGIKGAIIKAAPHVICGIIGLPC